MGKDYYAECKECKKFGTMDCPNSSKCFDTEDMPYFEQIEKESKWKQFTRWLKRTKRNLFNR